MQKVKRTRKYRFGGASLLVSVGRWGGLHWHVNRRWQRIVIGWVSIWFGAVDLDAVMFFHVGKIEKLEKLLVKARTDLELLVKARVDLAYERSKASTKLNRMAANVHLN